MKIVALVGESGTGKSHKAMNLAFSKGIRYIIDDGLLICETKRIAGKSAKREATKLAAVRRAIFQFDDHRDEVRQAIDSLKVDKILVVGTSDRMVQNIVQQLGIGNIDEYIYINEISTPEEIQMARESRMKHGKHVIPLPTVEVKRDFSGYFLDSVKTIIRRREHLTEISEKTIVRPTFSYLGRFTIANRVILQIIEHACSLNSQVYEVYKIRFQKNEEEIQLEIDICLKMSKSIVQAATEVQTEIKEALENMTRLHVVSVNIHVKNLSFLS